MPPATQDQILADWPLSSSTHWWMKPSHCVQWHKQRSTNVPQSPSLCSRWLAVPAVYQPLGLPFSITWVLRQTGRKTRLSHKPLHSSKKQLCDRHIMELRNWILLPYAGLKVSSSFGVAQFIYIQTWIRIWISKWTTSLCCVTMTHVSYLKTPCGNWHKHNVERRYLRFTTDNCTVTLNIILRFTISAINMHLPLVCLSASHRTAMTTCQSIYNMTAQLL